MPATTSSARSSSCRSRAISASDRDAIVAGITAGPLAMLPAFLFFICMCAFVPAIAGEALPSDYLLARLDQPWFRYLFQVMIFAALLESGTGAVHAVNERISTVWQARTRTPLSARARGALALALLVICMLIADRVGLGRAHRQWLSRARLCVDCRVRRAAAHHRRMATVEGRPV